MMRSSRSFLLLVLAAVTLLAAAPAAVPTAVSSPDDAAQRTFERFKELAGRWQADSTKGWSEEITFEVIAKGSVVMSTTTFKDAPGSKMVTMYSLDGDRLVATHYCEARNQPHLVASEISDALDVVRFTFERGGNLPSRDQGHMDQAVFHFVDADSFSSRWTWYQDGGDRWLEEIEYRRLH